jgi:hypothetical protein
MFVSLRLVRVSRQADTEGNRSIFRAFSKAIAFEKAGNWRIFEAVPIVTKRTSDDET